MRAFFTEIYDELNNRKLMIIITIITINNNNNNNNHVWTMASPSGGELARDPALELGVRDSCLLFLV